MKKPNKYTISFEKRFWPPHLDPDSPEYDPETVDVPVPYTSDERTYKISANSEKEAIRKAEKEYGAGERVDKDGSYVKNPDGSWVVMLIGDTEL